MPDKVPRLLVIDDSKVIRTLLAAEIEAHGYRVETAEDGMSGLAKGSGGDFDLILIDAMMPGVTGFEVCRKLADLRRDGRPRLVMFSNRSKDYSTRQNAAAAGADAFLAKQDAARIVADLARLLTAG